MRELPAKLRSDVVPSFADFTIKRRFPAILEGVAATLDGPAAATIRSLEKAITSDSMIDTGLLGGRSPWWDERASRAAGTRWRDWPFMDLEFMFYRAIDQIAEGRDPFLPAKRKAGGQLGREFLRDLEASTNAGQRLTSLLQKSTFANDHDPSQMASDGCDGHPRDVERLLADDSKRWVDDLAVRQGGLRIGLVLDNIGRELAADFTLATALVRDSRVSSVDLHAKSMPMFVSDVCASDVDTFVDTLADHDDAFARRIAEDIRTGRANGTIGLRTAEDWSEARDFSELSAQLLQELKAYDLLIFKGDLNSRRFIGDRAWTWSTPPEAASARVPFRAISLRSLKSEVLVGVSAERSAQATARRENWLTDGYFGVIQYMGYEARRYDVGTTVADHLC